MRVCYIDHSFHKKTKSTSFLRDILERNGADVDVVWDDSWCGGDGVLLDDYIGEYDAFVFFQLYPKASKPYYKMPVNATYVPMLDFFGNENCFHYHTNHWKNFSKVKVLSFSKALHVAAVSHGLASRYFQYFPNPGEFRITRPKDLSVFFWQRNANMIGWNRVKVLLGETKVNAVHLHMAADPGADLEHPSKAEVEKYKINFTEWFPDHQAYYDKVLENKVFFAPRISEGIGMSFLEAMAMGRCVVAPNFGTMNEYILDGQNGLLYEYGKEKSLNFEKVDDICRNAREYMEHGYAKWKEREDDLVNHILLPSDKVYYSFYGANVDFSALAREDEGKGAIEVETDLRFRVRRRLRNNPVLAKIYSEIRKK
jgi:glycosyltransferase involved in cell wall biosynthesis